MSARLAEAGAAPEPLPAAAPPEEEVPPGLALPPEEELPPEEVVPPLLVLPPLASPPLLSEEHPSAGSRVQMTSPKRVNFQKCIQLLALVKNPLASSTRRASAPRLCLSRGL